MASKESIIRIAADTRGANDSIKKLERTLEGFGQKNLTLNGILGQGVAVLGKFAAGFAAVELAGKAFNAVLDGSQRIGDEFRNSMSAAKDSVGELLTSFATADFSPMIDGFDKLIERAKAAAEAMDTYFNVRLSSGLISSEESANFQEALSTMRDKNASKADKAAAKAAAEKALEGFRETNSATEKAAMDVIRTRLAEKTGMDASRITDGMIDRAARGMGTARGQADVARAKARVADTQPKRSSEVQNASAWGTIHASNANYDSEMEKWNANRSLDADRVMAAFHEISDDKYQDAIQKLSDVANSRRQVAKMETTLNRAESTGSGGSGSGGGKTAAGVKSGLRIDDFAARNPFATTESMNALQAQLKRAEAAKAAATTALDADAADRAIAEAQRLIDAQPLALRLGISAEAAAEVQEGVKSLADQMAADAKVNLQPMVIDTKGSGTVKKDAKATAEAWSEAARALQSAGSALGNMDSKGLNIAGLVMEATASIALSFAQAMKKPESQAGGVFGWIAASMAGLATMTATIASIKKQAGSYAEGGMVPGAYNGGVDDTYVYASPGEVILNRAQQNNLLGQLEGGDGGRGGEAYVRGETMYLALSNYMRRTGKRFG